MSNETTESPTLEPLSGLKNKQLGRRGFIGAAGALGAAAFLAACGSDAKSDSSSTTAAGSPSTTAGKTPTTAASGGGDDLATGAFAASLEVLAGFGAAFLGLRDLRGVIVGVSHCRNDRRV